MTAVRGIAEIVLWLHSMEASLKFYRDALGLQVISPGHMQSPVFLQAGEGTRGVPQLVVLVQLPSDAPTFESPRTLHHLALELSPDAFDSEHARLAALGYSLRGGKHPILSARTMYLNDPDGNEVELLC